MRRSSGSPPPPGTGNQNQHHPPKSRQLTGARPEPNELAGCTRRQEQATRFGMMGSGCIGPPSPSLPCQEMALVNQNQNQNPRYR